MFVKHYSIPSGSFYLEAEVFSLKIYVNFACYRKSFVKRIIGHDSTWDTNFTVGDIVSKLCTTECSKVSFIVASLDNMDKGIFSEQDFCMDHAATNMDVVHLKHRGINIQVIS